MNCNKNQKVSKNREKMTYPKDNYETVQKQIKQFMLLKQNVDIISIDSYKQNILLVTVPFSLSKH